jgi:crotonobetainyl-CoA:carnitine CoA-transferase CaiB-like acyl-CoA transferase
VTDAAAPSASSAGSALPLAGVRVLDLTRLLPGNSATLVLAGLGADVVKVEDPRFGDGTRLRPRTPSQEQSGPHLALTAASAPRRRPKHPEAVRAARPRGSRRGARRLLPP